MSSAFAGNPTNNWVPCKNKIHLIDPDWPDCPQCLNTAKPLPGRPSEQADRDTRGLRVVKNEPSDSTPLSNIDIETLTPIDNDNDNPSPEHEPVSAMERFRERHPERSPFGKWRTAEELKKLVVPADPLIQTETDECVIAHRRSTCLCGKPGCGKTTATLISAIEAARSGGHAPFANFEEGHEFGTAELQQKLQQLEPDTAVWWDKIQVIEPSADWTPEDLSLIREVAIEWALQAPKPEHSLVIIDSISKAGGALNNADEFSAWFDEHIEPITKAGLGVMCVAHEPKNGETKGPLGSVLAKAFFQNVFRIESLNGQVMWSKEAAGEASWIPLKERYNDSRKPTDTPMAILSIEPDSGRLRYSFRSPDPKTIQELNAKPKRRSFEQLVEQIFALVDEQRNKTWDSGIQAICDKLGCSPNSAGKALDFLVDAGRFDSDKTGRAHRYWVPLSNIVIDRGRG